MDNEKFLSIVLNLDGAEHLEILDKWTPTITRIRGRCKIHGEELSRTPRLWIERKTAGYCMQCGHRLGKYTEEHFKLLCARLKRFKFNDYSKTKFKSFETKVSVKCRTHSIFYTQKARSHILGDIGCPQCKLDNNRMGLSEWKSRSIKKYGDKFNLSLITKYITEHNLVDLTCEEHGQFTTTFRSHLKSKFGGCNQCGIDSARSLNKKDTETFILEAIKVHGNLYGYNKTDYVGANNKVLIECRVHGHFEQKASDHTAGGYGCRNCGLDKTGLDKRLTTEGLRLRGRAKFSNIDYDNSYCQRSTDIAKFRCKTHNVIFTQNVTSHLCGATGGCPKCYTNSSEFEEEIFDYLKDNYKGNILRGNRSTITSPKGHPLELDILIPELKLAIEVNGVYFHSEARPPSWGISPSARHIYKSKECEKSGIRLIHIFEDEWSEHRPAVESMLSNIVNNTLVKIHARKCLVSEIPTELARTFLDEYHIQGYCKSSVKYGIWCEGALRGVMTFSKNLSSRKKRSEGQWELSRYATESRIMGGMSKIIKQFERDYSPKNLTSYSDNCTFSGKAYESVGFNLVRNSRPDYQYVQGKSRIHKSKFRRSRLKDRFANYDPSLSEKVNCLNNGLYRIWDCGKKKWEMEF